METIHNADSVRPQPLPSEEPSSTENKTHAEQDEAAFNPEGFSPRFVESVLPLIEPWYREWFRVEVRGFERVPERAPAFLVGNHNGLGAVEVPMLLYAWYKHFGPRRAAHGLTHKAALATPGLGEFLRKIGAVPAAPDTAYEVLGAGRDLLVFPGGDWEASRPTYERAKIDFAGRKGFVRVALETGVPLVPLVICGAHETTLILSRGAETAHSLGIDKIFRSKTLPFFIAPPLLPSKITMEFLEPVDLRSELAGIDEHEEKLARGYEIVTARMQEKLTELYAERRGFFG